MTVALAFNTQDGAVIATDSTVTVGSPGRPVDCAQKIFQIGPNREWFDSGEHFSGCIALYNEAKCGPKSWRNVINDFYRDKIKPAPGVVGVGTAFLAFVQATWANLQQTGAVAPGEPLPDTGFLIAAISQGQSQVECTQVVLRTATVVPLLPGQVAMAAGQEIISRIVYGYDFGIKAALLQGGVDPAIFDQATKNFVAVPPMTAPLREAIDYVYFLASSSVRLLRYRGAPPTIGGPIEVAAVTADRGFRWVLHKSLHEAIDKPRTAL